jgi:hypothetical protein
MCEETFARRALVRASEFHLTLLLDNLFFAASHPPPTSEEASCLMIILQTLHADFVSHLDLTTSMGGRRVSEETGESSVAEEKSMLIHSPLDLECSSCHRRRKKIQFQKEASENLSSFPPS